VESWRVFAGAGGLLGGLGVLAGAFGAHALRDVLAAPALETWKTAVLYHLVHSVLVVAVGIWCRFRTVSANLPCLPLKCAGWLLLTGIVLFSGSLYALALGGPSLLGPVTPLGGVTFVLGWIALVVAAVREDPAS
jgi:uncharacterized membrane protein YgdD (TMEM256/DUF423 family)